MGAVRFSFRGTPLALRKVFGEVAWHSRNSRCLSCTWLKPGGEKERCSSSPVGFHKFSKHPVLAQLGTHSFDKVSEALVAKKRPPPYWCEKWHEAGVRSSDLSQSATVLMKRMTDLSQSTISSGRPRPTCPLSSLVTATRLPVLA